MAVLTSSYHSPSEASNGYDEIFKPYKFCETDKQVLFTTYDFIKTCSAGPATVSKVRLLEPLELNPSKQVNSMTSSIK